MAWPFKVNAFEMDALSATATFESEETRVHVLRATGDFVIWGEAIVCCSFGIEPATILTLRWVPQH